MTLKSFVRHCIAMAAICICTSTFVQADDKKSDEILLKRPFTIVSDKETVTAITPDMGPVEQQEKLFTFDWNQQLTIAENKKRIDEEEKFIATIQDISKLNQEEQQALGILFYKLGAYYTHVLREPDLAIAKLTVANTLLSHIEDKVWNYNHLAYAFELKYATLGNPDDKERALYYINKVIFELVPHTKDKPIAFAYSLKGLIQSNAQDYLRAEKNLKIALAIYDAIPGSKDDQYARTKNRLANAILGQQGRDQEAIAIMKQVKHYWSSKGNLSQDPYAARCLISLGQAYLKTGKAKAACNEFKAAIIIYQKIYGNNSTLLVRPYELLAQAYKTLGNFNRASAYEKKANGINGIKSA